MSLVYDRDRQQRQPTFWVINDTDGQNHQCTFSVTFSDGDVLQGISLLRCETSRVMSARQACAPVMYGACCGSEVCDVNSDIARMSQSGESKLYTRNTGWSQVP